MSYDLAFIGVGRMGRAMCGHLRTAGFDVTTYDVAPAAREWASEQGFGVADSAEEAVRSAPIAILMAGFEHQVREVLVGEDGASGLRALTDVDSVLMVASTISPSTMREFGKTFDGGPIRLLDTPVCRGQRGAIEANLLWLVGGDADLLETCRPVMEACGPDVYHVGDLGAGQVAKAVNNMLLWAGLCADQEGLRLAEEFGVDTERLRRALVDSSATNWALVHWEDMHNIPWAQDDMQIVLRMAGEAGLELPMAKAIEERVATWDLDT